MKQILEEFGEMLLYLLFGGSSLLIFYHMLEFFAY